MDAINLCNHPIATRRLIRATGTPTQAKAIADVLPLDTEFSRFSPSWLGLILSPRASAFQRVPGGRRGSGGTSQAGTRRAGAFEVDLDAIGPMKLSYTGTSKPPGR